MNLLCREQLSSEMTVGRYLDYWYKTYALRTVKQSTAVSYRGYINNHIEPIIGSFKLSELDAELLQMFFNDRYDNGGVCGRPHLSPKTLSNIKRMLHRAMQKALDLELISRNYVESVELPKQQTVKMRVLTRSEQEKLLNQLEISNEKLAFGVYLCLVTGMRLGEVLGLKWSDVDLDTKILHINRTVNRLQSINGKSKTELVVGTPKSEKSIRDIPFTDKLVVEFVSYKQKSKEWLLKTPQSDDFILSLNYGRPSEPKTMQKHFKG